MNQDAVDIVAVILNQLPGRQVVVPKGDHEIVGNTIVIDDEGDRLVVRLINQEENEND